LNILLTGGTGYLGSKIAESLVSKHKVVILKRKSSKINFPLSSKNKLVFYDIENLSFKKLFQNLYSFDVVIHTATEYGREKTSYNSVKEINVEIPLELLRNAINQKVKYFINTDTYYNNEKAQINNLANYCKTKKMFVDEGSRLIQGENISFINMRLEHVYGPKDKSSKFINNILEKIKNNHELIDLSLCQQRRDFIYVDDVVRAFSIITENLTNFLTGFHQIGVGTGVDIKISDFLNIAKSITNSKSFLNYGAIPYSKNEIMDSKANISILSNFGWKANCSIDQGIKNVLDCIKINKK